MSAVRVGLVGCGRIAQLVHVGVLLRSRDLVLTAAADPVAERRAEIARRVPNVRAVADPHELFEMQDVEAVVICVPSGQHADAACAAFEHGKHVYLEKPLATGVADGRRVVESWRASGRVGMIGFNFRFDPQVHALKALLAQGRIGDLVALRTVFSSLPRELPEWKRARGSGGGVLLDFASHHVDLVRFLTGGKVSRVSARVASERTEDDTASLELTLADGLFVQSFFSSAATEEDRVEIHGREGKLSIDRFRTHRPVFTPAARPAGRLARLGLELRDAGAVARRAVHALRSSWEPSFDMALTHFAEAVRTGRAATPDLDDGLTCLEIIAAAERSARTGKVISLPLTDE